MADGIIRRLKININGAEACSSYNQVLFCSQMSGERAVPVNVSDIFKCVYL